MNYLIQTPAQLSAHLRSLRKSRGLTQSQLGAMVELDQTRIAKIERNPQLVSVAQLFRILSALGTQIRLQPKTKAVRAASTEDSSAW